MHLDGMSEMLEEPHPRFSSVRLQKQTAGTTHGCTCAPRTVPPMLKAWGPSLWRVGSQTGFLDGQLPVPRAGRPLAPRPRLHFRRTAVTCFETPPHRRRFPPTYLSLSLSLSVSHSLSGQCLPFASLPPEVGRLSLSGYGSRSGVGGRTGEAERRRWRWGWPWRSWCRGRALRWA